MSESDQSTTADEGTAIAPRRRRLLNWLAGLAIVSFIAGLVTPLKDLAVVAEAVGEGEPGANLPGQRLVFAHAHEQGPDGHTHEEGAVVTVDSLRAPDGALVYPEDLTQQDEYLINVHRLEPDSIGSPTDMELVANGFVAYSAICTHLGCSVSWSTDEHEVGGPHDHCPCHVGEFDPYHGAEVVGGPPPRPLPQIGVEINDADELVLTTAFQGTVGSE